MRRTVPSTLAQRHRLLAVTPLAIVASAALSSPANAQSAQARSQEPLEEVVIFARGENLIGKAAAASEGAVGGADLSVRPMLRVAELLEVVPGLIAAQHSGSGKANQYFLRGFNLDHGTDFTTYIDDVPMNLRTHGHGQGYLDLNGLIPEVVDRVDYRKGPYRADVGDFSLAGAAVHVDHRPAGRAVHRARSRPVRLAAHRRRRLHPTRRWRPDGRRPVENLRRPVGTAGRPRASVASGASTRATQRSGEMQLTLSGYHGEVASERADPGTRHRHATSAKTRSARSTTAPSARPLAGLPPLV